MILIVEDHALVRSALKRLIRRRDVVFAATVKDARHLIDASDAILAAIIDIGLPDGNGIDVIEHLRQRHGLVPVLVVTGINDPCLINRVHAAKAELVVKSSDHAANVKAFVRAAVETNITFHLRRFAAEKRLSEGECELLRVAAVTGTPRAYLHVVLRVKRSTVKTWVERIFKKTGFTNWSELIVHVQTLRDATPNPTNSHVRQRRPLAPERALELLSK